MGDGQEEGAGRPAAATEAKTESDEMKAARKRIRKRGAKSEKVEGEGFDESGGDEDK